MSWHGYLLHGGRSGSGDAALDTIMLIVPVAVAALVLVGPRLLALRGRKRPESEEQREGKPAARRGYHGDEPI